MRAKTAAAFCDEESVEAFLRAVPTIYSEPDVIPGKGSRWRRNRLEAAMDRFGREPGSAGDLADEL
jgi:hypothetical protein